MCRLHSTDFYTYACGGFEDQAKIPKDSDEWYLSFGAVAAMTI